MSTVNIQKKECRSKTFAGRKRIIKDHYINPSQIIGFFARKAYLRKKITIRLMPYAVIFAVIIVYTFIGNSHLLKYTDNLMKLTEAMAPQSMIQQQSPENFNALLVTEINSLQYESENFRIFIIVMFLIITLLLLSEFLLAGKGMNSMAEIVELADKIAEGNLLGKDIEIVNHRELQQIGSALNRMKHKLSSLVGNVSYTVDQLTSFSDHLLASSETISEDTKQQVFNTGKVASAVEMMSIVVYDVTRNSAKASGSAKEAADLATTGSSVVAETIKGMNRISQSVNKSANTITTLGNKSEQIGEIVKVINDIANQTNLLALNAAIEAARAGEQGRGFAVVADEVRKLAERTTSATNEIAETVKSIQEETQKAVDSMENATAEVHAGESLASEADTSLKKIVASVQSVMDMVQQIAQAAKQQGSTGEDVSSSLQEIADENQRTAHIAQEYFDTTKELNQLSRSLKSMVSSFTVNKDRGTDLS